MKTNVVKDAEPGQSPLRRSARLAQARTSKSHPETSPPINALGEENAELPTSGQPKVRSARRPLRLLSPRNDALPSLDQEEAPPTSQVNETRRNTRSTSRADQSSTEANITPRRQTRARVELLSAFEASVESSSSSQASQPARSQDTPEPLSISQSGPETQATVEARSSSQASAEVPSSSQTGPATTSQDIRAAAAEAARVASPLLSTLRATEVTLPPLPPIEIFPAQETLEGYDAQNSSGYSFFRKRPAQQRTSQAKVVSRWPNLPLFGLPRFAPNTLLRGDESSGTSQALGPARSQGIFESLRMSQSGPETRPIVVAQSSSLANAAVPNFPQCTNEAPKISQSGRKNQATVAQSSTRPRVGLLSTLLAGLESSSSSPASQPARSQEPKPLSTFRSGPVTRAIIAAQSSLQANAAVPSVSQHTNEPPKISQSGRDTQATVTQSTTRPRVGLSNTSLASVESSRSNQASQPARSQDIPKPPSTFRSGPVTRAIAIAQRSSQANSEVPSTSQTGSATTSQANLITRLLIQGYTYPIEKNINRPGLSSAEFRAAVAERVGLDDSPILSAFRTKEREVLASATGLRSLHEYSRSLSPPGETSRGDDEKVLVPTKVSGSLRSTGLSSADGTDTSAAAAVATDDSDCSVSSIVCRHLSTRPVGSPEEDNHSSSSISVITDPEDDVSVIPDPEDDVSVITDPEDDESRKKEKEVKEAVEEVEEEHLEDEEDSDLAEDRSLTSFGIVYQDDSENDDNKCDGGNDLVSAGTSGNYFNPDVTDDSECKKKELKVDNEGKPGETSGDDSSSDRTDDSEYKEEELMTDDCEDKLGETSGDDTSSDVTDDSEYKEEELMTDGNEGKPGETSGDDSSSDETDYSEYVEEELMTDNDEDTLNGTSGDDISSNGTDASEYKEEELMTDGNEDKPGDTSGDDSSSDGSDYSEYMEVELMHDDSEDKPNKKSGENSRSRTQVTDDPKYSAEGTNKVKKKPGKK